MNVKYLILYMSLLLGLFTQAQENASSDGLFQEARNEAFNKKNYPKAIALSKMALQKSPDYTDIQIFLGRLYTWSNKNDSARQVLHQVLNQHPDNEDASLASASLEFWNNQSKRALVIVNEGLTYHPQSPTLSLLKAKILNDLNDWEAANVEVEKVLKVNPTETEARALASRIRINLSKNMVGVSYDYIYFDKQFPNPWHLTAIDYTRRTKIGSVIGRLNYANRFNANGLQVEVDAYPKLSKVFQAYVNGGFSNDVGVFPHYRAGFSLYANLPKSYEAEVGFRYLNFGDHTWIYTASIGKYYKNYWFNIRTFLTPRNNDLSRSFSFITRYYFGGADDYLSLRLGTGLSPDNSQNNFLIGTTSRLTSNNITFGLRKLIKSFNVVFATLGVDNQTYRPGQNGNQFELGIGYIRRF